MTTPTSSGIPSRQEKNWAGNLTYSAARLHTPESLDEVRDLVKRGRKVKALGSRHSFNDIADTDHELISTRKLDNIVDIDRQRRTITVEAGITYGHLCERLNQEGFALHNMASLPHISIVGACATATHGSGDHNGGMATAVAGLELVKANGDVVTLTRERDGDIFRGAVVGLGALGVVTKVTLDLLPRFDMRQDVYINLPWAQVSKQFEGIASAAYSVSLFTTWRPDTVETVWLKSRLADRPDLGGTFFGATAAERAMAPIEEASVEACTEQMGIPGSWHERLPHFRMAFTPSHGEELQSEFFVPRINAVEAFSRIRALRDQITPHLLISEIRTIAADDLWMSPFYHQACVGLHFTWKQHWPEVEKLLPLIESALIPLGARPHWGKLFSIAPEHLKTVYPRLPDFVRLAKQYDPDGKFRNTFLDKYVFAD